MRQEETSGNDPLDRILVKVSWAARTVLIFAIALSIISRDLFLVFSSAIALFATFLPSLLKHQFKVYLPLEIEVFASLFIVVHLAMGEIIKLYQHTIWFDLALHYSTGFVMALIAYLLLVGFLLVNRVTARPRAIFFFSVLFAMGIGAMWEIFEFTIDQSLGFHMQYNSLSDTMWDLIATLVGAIVLGLIGIKYLAGEKYTLMDRLLRKMVHAHERRSNTRTTENQTTALPATVPQGEQQTREPPTSAAGPALPFAIPATGTRGARDKRRKGKRQTGKRISSRRILS